MPSFLKSRLLGRTPSPQTPFVVSPLQIHVDPSRLGPSTPGSRVFFKPFRNSSPGHRDVAVASTQEIVGHILGALQTASNLAAGAANDTGIQGLGAVLSTIAKILERLQMMRTTINGINTLLERVNLLLDRISGYISRPHDYQLPDNARERIDGLVRTWLDIANRAQCVKGHGFVKRFFTGAADARVLEGFVGEISASIQEDFLLGGILDIEENLQCVRRGVERVRENVEAVAESVALVDGHVDMVNENLTAVSDSVGLANDGIRMIIEGLDASFISRYAKNAQYNANGARRGCLDGTRTEVLDRLRSWVIIACACRSNIPSGGAVYWIDGLGGTGKTTVAYSLTEWCIAKGILAGNFFCSRSDAECSDPNMIFVTLSRQLCHFHAPFKEKIDVALRNKPDIAHSGPESQFIELLLLPLEALEEFPRSVVILDALDECGGKATSIILLIIAKFIHRIARFLVFIVTSRPEEHISALFEECRKDSLKDSTTSLIMHEIPLDTVVVDIRRYLDHEFGEQVGRLGVKEGWPSPGEKDKLADLAHGLFIYVATAIPFVMDERYSDPKGQLRLLLGDQLDSEDSKIFLRALYTKIMVASTSEVSPALARRLRDVVGTIVTAQEPLSTSTLARLVGLDEESVKNTLVGLRSVLYIPNDSHQPIHIIHPTFPEFLLQPPAKSPTAAFHVHHASQHWFLFTKCLEAMAFLKRDMVDIRYPAKFKSEIRDFADMTLDFIPPHVRYACRYWAFHLCGGLGESDKINALALLRGFVRERLLFWLGACILLELSAIHALDAAANACRTLGGAFTEVVTLLADYRRFIQTYSSAMHMAPLQLYHFALPIAPTDCSFKALYSQQLGQSVIVRQGAPSCWWPTLDTVVGHGGRGVFSVAFSLDGSCFASGGGDGQLRIWDSTTCIELQSFDGHANAVNCVAFSPDGVHVASGSDDKRVCIWEVSSGTHVRTLEGHTSYANSVVYSADGSRILFATYEGKVTLWDTVDGRCIFTLPETGTWTWQVALSPNGNVIARGEGVSIVLHDVSSAIQETLSLPGKVKTCTFSPDGCYIAARTDHAIRVWASADKLLIRSIDTPSSTLTSRLAFSYDNKYIACGSESGPIHVWEVASQDPPHTMNGHTNLVWDVSWSPGRLKLASASDDGTVRLWDGALHSATAETPVASAHQPTLPDHPRFVFIRHYLDATLLHLPSLGIEHFPYSPRLPEGAPVVAVFSDVVAAFDATLQSGSNLSTSTASARHWAFLTGQQHTKLGWRPVAVSPDGSRLAYISPTSDKVVNVCALQTGAVVATLRGHTQDVRSVVFSPDGTCLTTGSFDLTVKLWDAATGAPICSHAEHQDWVHVTSFSSDGRLVASGSEDKTARVFDVATERVVHVYGPHEDRVVEVMFTADNEHIVVLDDSHEISVWKVLTEALVHHFSFDDSTWLRTLTFSSNTVGIRIDHDTSQITIRLWQPSPGQAGFLLSSGWAYARFTNSAHRLCWIPPEWRTCLDWDGSTLYLYEAGVDAHSRGRLIDIEMANMLAYVHNLDLNPS